MLVVGKIQYISLGTSLIFTVHYEKLFKVCQNKFQGEGPTGILLVYPQHCVHLMEASWDIVCEVVENLHTMDTTG